MRAMIVFDKHYLAPMHQSLVTTAPLLGWAGDSGANVQGSDLFEFPGSAGPVILRKYTPVEFTIIKSRAMTHSRSPQCRAVMDEKSSPLFPVGGEGGDRGYKWLVHYFHLFIL